MKLTWMKVINNMKGEIHGLGPTQIYIYMRWLLILIYHIQNRNGNEMSFWCNVNRACSHACGPKVSQWDTYRYNAYIWIPPEDAFIQCNKWSQNTILTFLGCLDYLKTMSGCMRPTQSYWECLWEHTWVHTVWKLLGNSRNTHGHTYGNYYIWNIGNNLFWTLIQFGVFSWIRTLSSTNQNIGVKIVAMLEIGTSN